MLMAAIEKVARAGRVTVRCIIARQALRDALYATSGLEGITGTLNCNEYGDCADPLITVNQIQGGEYVPIWTAD